MKNMFGIKLSLDISHLWRLGLFIISTPCPLDKAIDFAPLVLFELCENY